jgi:glycosyltransferase involved in cell wall biosynthesis
MPILNHETQGEMPLKTEPDGPISVLLFRNIPEHDSRSMERFADEMAAGLRGRPQVRVNEATIHASRLEGHRFLRKLDRYSSSYVRYPRHARRQSADIYHVIDHAFGHLLGSIQAERAIITCHDLMLLHAEHDDIGFRGRRLAVRRFRWSTSFLRRAALVACVSEATANDVTNLLGISSSQIRVIPLGVGSAFVPMDAQTRSEARRKIDPTGERALVLHVSTGGAYKNVPATLRVIDALRSQGIDPILLRIGRPLDAREVALAKELGVHDRVREFTGVSDAELATVYAAADVLLFPSRWEGFGWPPLEALACGTPSVVAAECRSVVDLVGDAALAAPADDVAALSEAVRRIVVTPSLRESLVERGRPRVTALTWKRTVDLYVDAYEEIASRFS